ncbi:MAG: hypothetical protein K1X92_04270 [Bacteroidia bacterium]|nr:hypothetical protein [Bacteroidia bacterium]
MKTDVSKEILKMQLQLATSLDMKERWKRSFEMIEMGIYIVRQNIKRKNPGISEEDLRIATFMRVYQQDYSKVEMERITEKMRVYYRIHTLQ